VLNREAPEDTRQLVRAAAHWLALLESGSASQAQHAELQHWRSLSTAHEQAWQRAQAFKQRFAGLPTELAMATLDRPDGERRRMLKGLLGFAALAPAAWFVARELPLDAWGADLSTATGERRRLTLADGSVLDLNTATAVDLDPDRRGLRLLRGEIALRRAQPSPFVIRTAFAEATLVAGGDLCVRQYETGCEFSVASGNLDVRAQDGSRWRVPQGKRLRLPAQAGVPLQPFDVAQPGWREGVLVANDERLGDFLRELDRYHPGILRWDASLETLRVTGSFRLDDTDRILQLLAASLPLEVRSRSRYWVSLVPRDRVGA